MRHRHRDARGLCEALAVIEQVARAGRLEPALLNMTAAAKLVTAAALARQESRGGHCRTDFPTTRETSKRTFMTLADADGIARNGLATSVQRAAC